MSRIITEIDDFDGMITKTHVDGSGIVTEQRIQDCQNVLDNNKRLREQGFDKKSDIWRGFSVPVGVLELWHTELKNMGADYHDPLHKANKKWLKAKLESAEWKFLRTR